MPPIMQPGNASPTMGPQMGSPMAMQIIGVAPAQGSLMSRQTSQEMLPGRQVSQEDEQPGTPESPPRSTAAWLKDHVPTTPEPQPGGPRSRAGCQARERLRPGRLAGALQWSPTEGGHSESLYGWRDYRLGGRW
jgi:hypothetical protein